MQVGCGEPMALAAAWQRAQFYSHHDVTLARFVPAGGQIEWAGLVFLTTASVVLFGGVEVRHRHLP